jgi:hypothetical protein
MEERAVEWTEWLVHQVFFWETDNEKKGRFVRAIHHFASYSLLTMIVVAHTLYPAFWLQTSLLFLCGLVWIHHMLTHGCVISKVEQKLIGDDGSFLDPFLEMFGIEVSERSKQGILMLGSTLGMFLLVLEWIGRVHHYSIAALRQAPSLIASSIANIHPLTSSLSK